MSENPYQTPESMPMLADAQEEVNGDFSLLRSTSLWAVLCVLFLVVETIFTVLAVSGVWRNIILSISIGKVIVSLWGLIIVTLCIWTHKSMTNAWVGGKPTPTITSASAVWSYFIPILWFWRPFVAMKQMWQNLFGMNSSKALIISWWGLWCGFWVLAQVKKLYWNGGGGIFGGRLDLYYVTNYGSLLCKILAGILLIIIISKITMGQNRRIAGARS